MKRDSFTLDSAEKSAQIYEMDGKYLTNKDDSAPANSETPMTETVSKTVGLFELFRYADGIDKFLVVVGLLVAAFHGTIIVIRMVIFGDMADMFIDDARFSNWLDEYWDNITWIFPNVTKNEIIDDPSILLPILEAYNMTDLIDDLQEALGGDLMEQMSEYAIRYAILGAIVWVLGYIQVYCLKVSATRQSLRIRSKLFQAILKQDMGWFDTHESRELGNRLTEDILRIEAGIGEQTSYAVQNFMTFLSGLLVGFLYGWQLTLVMLCLVPLMATIIGLMSKFASTISKRELVAYAKAGAIAEEVIGAIRTVTAFGGQQKESFRYSSNLTDAKNLGIKKGFTMGSGMGLAMFSIFGFNSIIFLYGSKLVIDGVYSGGDVLVIFFCLMIGANCLASVGPSIQDISTAKGAAYAVFGIIEHEPAIDSSSEDGLKPDKVKGDIKFEDVVFRYPSRPNVPVLQSLSFSVNVGQTVALVGNSGCGKSTTVQLLQRFYDPLQGTVTLDGKDLRELNVKWLRAQIGLVSQEPVLFDKTIAENIVMGGDDVTEDQVEAAAKAANAHDFIMKLPQGYATLVGERGAQLSGGQKQRVAIARALVRDPRILLLDEATSALDNESESIVQAALDNARQGRTTIVIAHRLSTIKTADVIVGIQDGVVAEEGTHEELMGKGGIYYQLVTNQSRDGGKGDPSSPSSPLTDPAQLWNKEMLQRATSVTSEKSVVCEVEEKEVYEDPPVKRVMRLNSPEWPYLLAGCLSALVDGCILPFFSVLIAEVIGIFSLLDEEEQKDDAISYTILFAVLGVVGGSAAFCRNYCFAISGESLTLRLRELTFKSLLKQDIAFYDEPCHSTGALTARLAVDASAVQGATGSRLSSLCQSLSALAAGVTIGFVFSWKLTLLILAFAPFMVISAFIRARAQYRVFRTPNDTDEKTEGAGKISTEAIEHIRTVASLSKEVEFFEEYSEVINLRSHQVLRASHVEGLAYGFSQALLFFSYAACYMYGAHLVREDDLAFHNVFKVISGMMFAMMSAGQATSFAPDYGKAKVAAARLFAILDREPPIDITSEEGKKLEHVQGNVEFNDVDFNYPTRPSVPVLRGTTLTVKAGQMVALVGSSGCGKSTIVQLLERFYDPLKGVITLDGHQLTDLHLQWMRAQMGIMSQEPVLFDRSIEENIAYGDNSRRVPMGEIVDAAKNANIHNFISALPNGYHTNVGEKGAQLSGGQKQRVAIARALVRNPKILLLDEATSALDTESEKIVQEALDKAQEGRTSIVIAHRLSTIQHADCIIVINNGRLAELGTHSELLASKGVYYTLHKAQHRKT